MGQCDGLSAESQQARPIRPARGPSHPWDTGEHSSESVVGDATDHPRTVAWINPIIIIIILVLIIGRSQVLPRMRPSSGSTRGRSSLRLAQELHAPASCR